MNTQDYLISKVCGCSQAAPAQMPQTEPAQRVRVDTGVLPTLRDTHPQGPSEIICGKEPAIIVRVYGSLNTPLSFLPQLLVLECAGNFSIEVFPGHERLYS